MDESQVVAYLDGTLPPADRDRIEAHLAECVECRDEVVESRGLLGKARRPRRLLISGGILAAAAALLLVVSPTLRDSERAPSNVTVRDTRNPTAIVAHGPIGETSRLGLRFAWKPDPDATTYHLTLTGEDGVPVWSASGTDTSVILPDSIALRADARYFWIVDALLGSGGTRSTGLTEFRPMK